MTTQNTVLLLTAALLMPACACAQSGLPQRYQIFTLIGGDAPVDGVPAKSAYLHGPYRIAVASDGTLYFGESFGYAIRKVTPDGILMTVAGNGTVGNSGDGGPATVAQIGADINGVAVDVQGNLFFSDTNFTVRKVDTVGIVTRFAGTGQSGFSGDGGPANAARLGVTNGVATDTSGNVYVATADGRVRRITPDGIIQTIAGNGQAGHSGDGGAALAAALDRPNALATDSTGNLYIGEGGYRVRRVSPDGRITTVAGNGTYGFSGEGIAATSSRLGMVASLAAHSDGSLYIAERASDMIAAPFSRVRKLTLDGKLVTVVAGKGVGYSEMGIPATEALAGWINSLAFDRVGNLYFTDHYNHQINRVDPAGMLAPFAGRPRFAGDGEPAYRAVTTFTTGIAADANGNIYLSDVWNRRVRKIDSSLMVSTFAGNGIFGDYGDGLPADAASLSWTNQMVALPDGALLVADFANNRIRRIDSAGIMTTIAGTGQAGSSGDGGPAVNSQLNQPFGLAVDAAMNVYIAEYSGHRIRKVSPDGTISTIAGKGSAGYSGDDGPARDAQFNGPRSLAVDATGNLYVADFGNLRIRRITPDGTISTFAGNGKAGSSGDGGPATSASINGPWGLVFDPFGALIFTSNSTSAGLPRGGQVRRIRPDGAIDTIAGTGEPGVAGDGGYATNATMNFPDSLAIDSLGRVLVTDRFNQRVRVLIPAN